MRETRDILASIDALGDHRRGVLATVLDVRGSGYRLPGARMLMTSDGGTFGTVSGGCLEADVLERAQKVLETGRAEVFTYDTTADESSVFSLNMGCRGVIRILLESVGAADMLIDRLRSTVDQRQRQTVATLISAETVADVSLGGRMFLNDAGDVEFDRLPHFLKNLSELSESCTRFFDSGAACETETYDIPEGSFEFAFEAIEPPVAVLLFGAGADAVPMARITAELGWELTVFDHRPAFLTAERFPTADRLVFPDESGSYGDPAADRRTAAIVMTHNYGRDRGILPLLLRSDAFYVGALGPKRRTEQLLGELASAGDNFTEAELARLYAPVGLDIGADTPEAIAASIAAEIQGVLKNRGGGHLRERQGSIYDRK
ncbi:MAG: XdhC family protein [Pyrinomonadaceae bacterium]|nr:XdhC family protein [Pyrinomonadaceae bacterium]MBP6211856.1 XdhC family protein [Pyrinomonadaceae bacterium]